MPLNYSSYLKLDRLLQLQEPKSDPVEHDEMLFIVIHQVYELWFKQLLHEIDRLNVSLSAGDLFASLTTLKPMTSFWGESSSARGIATSTDHPDSVMEAAATQPLSHPRFFIPLRA